MYKFYVYVTYIHCTVHIMCVYDFLKKIFLKLFIFETERDGS